MSKNKTGSLEELEKSIPITDNEVTVNNTDEKTPEDKESVILLAGAGASVHLGLPTLDDLLKHAVIGDDDIAQRIRMTKDSIEAEPQRYRKAVFEELIVRIKDYIRIAYTIRTDTSFRHGMSQIPYDFDNGHIELKWKRALTRCYRALLDEYGPNKINKENKEFSVTIELFKAISKLNNGSLHIFTTNYDCSYQVFGNQTNELNIKSHIDNSNGRFKDAWFPIKKELENKNIPSIYIHRLHGCVAWFRTNNNMDLTSDDCGIIEEVYGAGDKLTIEDDDYLNNMCIKLVSSQLLGTNPVFSSSFEEFNSYLKKSKVLLVWGYSFRDLEVLRQINHICSTSENPIKILLLDPYLSENSAMVNIRRTFHSAPITIAQKFIPKEIKWIPNRGYDEFISTIINKLEEELKLL